MKEKLNKDERMMKELRLLRREGEGLVRKFSKDFDVSSLTIREDLAELSKLVSYITIVKTYGKAELVITPPPYAHTYYGEVKLKKNMEGKTLIGAYTAEYEIEDDEHLLLDTGSTIFVFVQQLQAKERLGLHVMSYSSTLDQLFAIFLGAEYIQLGGLMDKHCMCFLGYPDGEKFYEPYGQANFKAVMTGTGFRYEDGLTVNTPEIIKSKTHFINAASKVLFLIDHTKFSAFARKTVTNLGIRPDKWLKTAKPARIVIDTDWEKEKNGKDKIAHDFERLCEHKDITKVELSDEVTRKYPSICVLETTLKVSQEKNEKQE